MEQFWNVDVHIRIDFLVLWLISALDIVLWRRNAAFFA